MPNRKNFSYSSISLRLYKLYGIFYVYITATVHCYVYTLYIQSAQKSRAFFEKAFVQTRKTHTLIISTWQYVFKEIYIYVLRIYIPRLTTSRIKSITVGLIKFLNFRQYFQFGAGVTSSPYLRLRLFFIQSDAKDIFICLLPLLTRSWLIHLWRARLSVQ